MNKVTLSAVALAAIAAPVQIQAADMTEAEIIAANKASYDKISLAIAEAINYVEKLEDVKATYLTQLSAKQAELEALNKKEVITPEKEAQLIGEVQTIRDNAANAQAPYDKKKLLVTQNTALQKQYTDAQGEVAKYEAIKDAKLAALKALGVEQINADVEAFDVTTTEELNERYNNLKGRISTAKSKITELTANLAKENAAVLEYNSAYKQVNDAVVAAKANYNAKVQEAIALLPSVPYQDWQDEAIKKLNDEYRKIVAAEKDNKSEDHDAVVANAPTNLAAVQTANGVINTILGTYASKKQVQEDAYKKWKDDVAKNDTDLADVKAELTRCKITSLNSTVTEIEGLISARQKAVEDAYTKHTADKLESTGIATKITNLNKDAQPLIANYDAYQGHLRTINGLTTAYNNAEKAAQTASKDGAYNAAAHMSVYGGTIETEIGKLKTAAETAYKNKKSTTHKVVTTTVDGIIRNYTAWATAALASYETAAKKIVDATAELKKLKDVSEENRNVTLDGKVPSAKGTYAALITELEGKINAIKSSINTANTKDGEAHKTAMANAAALPYTDVTAYNNKDAYAAAKAEFEKNTSIVAATNIKTQATALVESLTARLEAANTGEELGNQQETIEGKISTLSAKIAKADEEIRKAGEVTGKNANSIIASLSTVYDNLQKLEPEVEEVEKAAADARENYSLYKEVNALYTEVDGLYWDINVQLGRTAPYYRELMSGYRATLDEAFGNLTKAYEEVKMSKLAETLKISLEGTKEDLNQVIGLATANDNAWNTQLAAQEPLQELWQKVYTNISENDLSSKADFYLKRLATEQQNITALNTEIDEIWSKGQSVEKTKYIAEKKSAIEKAIKAIQGEQAEGYNAAIAADNEAQHELFANEELTGHWDAAYAEFQAAVNTLNEFSAIKNEALKVALDNLVETHTKIYAYAEKLTGLATRESKAWGDVVSPDQYFSKDYNDEADAFKSEIKALIDAYTKAVNDKAIELYEETIGAADGAVYFAEESIMDFEYPDKANAFKDIKDVLKDAYAAMSNNDPRFAVKLDGWLETISMDVIADKIAADKEAAADKEYQYHNDKAVKVYKAEVEGINALGAEYTSYVAKLSAKKTATIDAAADMYALSGANTFDSIEDIVAKIKGFYGGATNGHTAIYNEAKEKAENNAKNLEAYNNIISTLEAVEADYEELNNTISQLYVYSQLGDVYESVEAVASMLEGMHSDVEAWKQAGECDENEQSIKDFFAPDNLEGYVGQITQLKMLTVIREAEALTEATDKVKDLYNQAAAKDLSKVEGYDAKISQLYTDIDDVPARYAKLGEEIFGGAVDRYLELEAQIAEYGKILDEVAEHGAYAAAQTEITAAMAEVKASLDSALEKVAYDEALTKTYGEDAEDISDAVVNIEAEIQAKDEAGQLLLVKDNILNILGIVQDAIDDLLGDENEGLIKDYNRHVENAQIYNVLSNTLSQAENWFKEVQGIIADYTYAADYKMYGRDNNGNLTLVSKVEWYKTNLTADINTKKQQLETANKKFELQQTGELNSGINGLRSTIDNFYRDVTVNEGQETLKALDNLREQIWTASQKNNYGPKAEASLLKQYTDIKTAVTNARTFHNNVAAYSNTDVDIDGNKYEGTGGMHFIYVEEAFPIIMDKANEIADALDKYSDDAIELAYVVGDVNSDGKVNVKDYDAVRQIILSGNDKFDLDDEAMAWAADVNEDGSIDVADLSKISNYIFKGEAFGNVALSRRSSYLNNAVVAGELTTAVESEETTLFGKTVRIALNVNSTEELTGGQLDVTLPAGMKLVGVSATAATQGHDVAFNELANGAQRVLITSVENNVIAGNGAVAVLEVEVESGYNGGDINVQNILFTDSKARSLALTNNGGNATTGIDSVQAATMKERIYSVGGQMKKALQRGLNIVVGENGAKTVLKK